MNLAVRHVEAGKKRVMRIDFRLAASIALCAALAILQAAAASEAASATANAGATVVTPVTVTDLMFARVSQGGSGGTITMYLGGARPSGGKGSVVLQGVATGDMSVNISGGNNGAYTITLPPQMYISSASSDVTTGTFSKGAAGTSVVVAGDQVLKVVVKIKEGAATAYNAGDYSITIDYN